MSAEIDLPVLAASASRARRSSAVSDICVLCITYVYIIARMRGLLGV
jgi:hypothetical protein